MVARAIEALYEDRLGEHTEALAHHFARAEAWDRAFHYHRLSAQRAAGAYANQAAVTHCQDALALIADGRVTVGQAEHHDLESLLGACAFCTNELTLSAEAWERAAALSDEPGQAGLELGRGAYSLYWCHEFDRMHRSLDRMADFADANELPLVKLEANMIRAFYDATSSGKIEPLIRLSEQSLSASENNDEVSALANFLFGECAEWRGDYPRAQEYTTRAVALSQRVGRPEFGFAAEWFRAKAVGASGAFPEANRQLLGLLERVEQVGDRALRTRVLNTLGWIHGEAGDHLRAIDYNRRSAEMARELEELQLVAGAPEIRGNASINLAINHLVLGDAGAAEAHLAPVRAHVESTGDPWMVWRYRLHLLDAEARLALVRGEADRAWTLAAQELEGAQQHGARKLEARALELNGRALLALDRREDSEAALLDAISVAAELGYRPVQWRSFALLSELARRRELTDERQRYHASMRTLRLVDPREAARGRASPPGH
jgi:tetratricopeptide (TPR) repeat protein